MKSLFKKTGPNDNKNPELPKSSKDEIKSDESITSFFKDLVRKKTASSSRTKQRDDIIVKKNSIEKKGEVSRTSTFSGLKTTDIKQNKDILDSKWVDLGSQDFGRSFGHEASRSDNFGSGDSLALKTRKSTNKNIKTESGESPGHEKGSASLLQRRTIKKDIGNESTDSISGARRGSTDSISGARQGSTISTKDTLKAQLELQRQEFSNSFGSAISSGVPIKVKIRELITKLDNSSLLGESSDSSMLSITGATNVRLATNIGSSDTETDEIQEKYILQESSRQEIVRERWISAIQMVIRGGRATRAMSGIPKDLAMSGSIKKEIIDDPQNSNCIPGIIKNSNSSKTGNQRAKIISLLRKPTFYRGPEQMNALDEVLKTLPAFARYSKFFRMKLIEKGTLLDLDPYRVVIRQGGFPLSLYFLLSGKCISETIVVKNGKGFIRRSNISPGEAFGEFGVSSEEKRGCTVHTIAQSVVFSVSREVYLQMMKEEVMINKSEKIEVLRSIPAFQEISSTILDSVLASSYVYRYEPSFPLLKTGERDNVYIILEGQCRANRLIPFLVTNQTKVEALTPEITGAYVPGVKPGPDESVLYYNMSIGILGPGSFFPRISLLRHEGLQYRLQKFEVAKIILLVNSILKHKPKDGPLADKTNIAAIFNQELSEEANDLEDMIAGVDLSVNTIDKITCLAISKMDLVKILPEEVLRDMTSFDAEGLVGFSFAEIQQNYFDKIQWKGYRDEVINNVIEKKASIKGK